MSKHELLIPAGDMDSLRQAVYNGADAVYLGCKLFGARKLSFFKKLKRHFCVF